MAISTTTKTLVLLTGGSGFLGFHVLLQLLQSGYSVRAAVRSQAKADKVASHPLIQSQLEPAPYSSNRLQFAIVPDLSLPGALNEAVRDATFVIHVASPVPAFGAREEVPAEKLHDVFVRDAVNGTLEVLRSAAEAPGSKVQRVVLTSSAVAVVPFAYLAASPDVDYSVRFGPESRLPDIERTTALASEMEAYAAGKAAALNAAERYIAEAAGTRAGAGVDLVAVVAGWMFGRDEVAESAAELTAGRTNSVLLGLLRGNKGTWPLNGNAALVDDVARVHVRALDVTGKVPHAPATTHTFVAAETIVWQDAVDVVRSEFADAVAAGVLSADGVQPTQPVLLDGSQTQHALEIKFAPFQEAVRRLAAQYIEFQQGQQQ